MIEVKNLYRDYNGARAVENLTFTVETGEIFGFLGPNGAGKTTTLRILSTVLKPDRGEAFLGGYPVTRQPGRVRKILGVCPQEIALFPELTVKENLVFFGLMLGLNKKDSRERAGELLPEIGLEKRAREKVSNLSGGLKRRLNLAVSLLHKPRYLLLDEPTVGLDPRSRAAIFNLLLRFKGDGVTILYTTHYLEEAERLCDRVGIMDGGKLLGLGTPGELKGLFDPQGNITMEEVFLRLTAG